MGKHKRKPPVFAGNVARQAQARYLRTKKPESERVQENREAAGPTAPAKGLTMIGIEFEKFLDTHGSVYYNI